MPLPRSVAVFNKYAANRVLRYPARFLPAMAMVHHVGRRSGRRYAIPVNIFRDGDDYIVPLTYGSRSDWVRNVIEAGGCDIETRGRRLRLTNPHVEIDREKPWAPGLIRVGLRWLDVHEVLRLTKAPERP